MTNLTIQTSPLSDFRVTIIPAAQTAKADALAQAKTIKTVSTEQEQADSIAIASLMKGLLRDVEKARVSVKEPVLTAGKQIDAAAKAFCTDLDLEVKRVEKLASDYQREQDRIMAAIRAEEERKQQAAREAEEAERRKEAEALKRLADEADAARRADLARIAAAKNEAELEIAQARADKAAAERAEEARLVQQACREAEEARLDEERSRAMQLHSIEAAKPEAARVVRRMNYELKDIRALYAARPDLVELTERRSLILAAISLPNGPAIPGIYVFEETKVQSKAS